MAQLGGVRSNNSRNNNGQKHSRPQHHQDHFGNNSGQESSRHHADLLLFREYKEVAPANTSDEIIKRAIKDHNGDATKIKEYLGSLHEAAAHPRTAGSHHLSKDVNDDEDWQEIGRKKPEKPKSSSKPSSSSSAARTGSEKNGTSSRNNKSGNSGSKSNQPSSSNNNSNGGGGENSSKQKNEKKSSSSSGKSSKNGATTAASSSSSSSSLKSSNVGAVENSAPSSTNVVATIPATSSVAVASAGTTAPGVILDASNVWANKTKLAEKLKSKDKPEQQQQQQLQQQQTVKESKSGKEKSRPSKSSDASKADASNTNATTPVNNVNPTIVAPAPPPVNVLNEESVSAVVAPTPAVVSVATTSANNAWGSGSRTAASIVSGTAPKSTGGNSKPTLAPALSSTLPTTAPVPVPSNPTTTSTTTASTTNTSTTSSSNTIAAPTVSSSSTNNSSNTAAVLNATSNLESSNQTQSILFGAFGNSRTQQTVATPVITGTSTVLNETQQQEQQRPPQPKEPEVKPVSTTRSVQFGAWGAKEKKMETVSVNSSTVASKPRSIPPGLEADNVVIQNQPVAQQQQQQLPSAVSQHSQIQQYQMPVVETSSRVDMPQQQQQQQQNKDIQYQGYPSQEDSQQQLHLQHSLQQQQQQQQNGAPGMMMMPQPGMAYDSMGGFSGMPQQGGSFQQHQMNFGNRGGRAKTRGSRNKPGTYMDRGGVVPPQGFSGVDPNNYSNGFYQGQQPDPAAAASMQYMQYPSGFGDAMYQASGFQGYYTGAPQGSLGNSQIPSAASTQALGNQPLLLNQLHQAELQGYGSNQDQQTLLNGMNGQNQIQNQQQGSHMLSQLQQQQPQQAQQLQIPHMGQLQQQHLHGSAAAMTSSSQVAGVQQQQGYGLSAAQQPQPTYAPASYGAAHPGMQYQYGYPANYYGAGASYGSTYPAYAQSTPQNYAYQQQQQQQQPSSAQLAQVPSQYQSSAQAQQQTQQQSKTVPPGYSASVASTATGTYAPANATSYMQPQNWSPYSYMQQAPQHHLAHPGQGYPQMPQQQQQQVPSQLPQNSQVDSYQTSWRA